MSEQLLQPISKPPATAGEAEKRTHSCTMSSCARDAYGKWLYPREWPSLVHGFFTQAIEEHAPQPLYLWPERARLLIAHSQHLTRADRFYLTTFLLANGVSPPHIVLWYLLRGCLRDEEAAVDVRGILSAWMKGELHTYTVWDMNEGDGAGLYVHPPGPGQPPRDRVASAPWREAFAMLDAYKPSKTNARLAYALRFHNLEARRRCTEVAYGGWRKTQAK